MSEPTLLPCFDFGDMAQNSVAAVWNNREYASFRERLASGTF